MTLLQNGLKQTAARLSESESKRITEAQAAAAKIFKDQRQAPGSEEALRRDIDEWRRGEPNTS